MIYIDHRGYQYQVTSWTNEYTHMSCLNNGDVVIMATDMLKPSGFALYSREAA